MDSSSIWYLAHKGRPRRKLPPPPPPPINWLGRLQVDGLAAFRIRLDFERHALALVQAVHSRHLERRGVNEHVLAAVFRRDEAEALAGVEKLHCSDRHVFS